MGTTLAEVVEETHEVEVVHASEEIHAVEEIQSEEVSSSSGELEAGLPEAVESQEAEDSASQASLNEE